MAEEVLQRTITEAPDYLRPGIEKYLDLATTQAGDAMDTSQFAPKVAGLGALQQQAQQQAATQAGLGQLQFDPTTGAVSGVQGTGVAGYEPFLQSAEQTLGGVQPFITAAQNRTGPQAYQAFESPYQSAVRDATLASFDEQAKQRQLGLSDAAIGAGAYGGGREGVQRAEYQRKSDMDRALLQAQLNQAGFTQANQLAAQAFGQQGMLGAQQGQLAGLTSGLANQQLGLAQSVPALQMGALNLGQGIAQQDFGFRQAQEDATRQGNRMQQFEAVDRLARLGQGITGLTPGGGSVVTSTGIPAATPSPLSQAATAGIGAFSIGKLFGL